MKVLSISILLIFALLFHLNLCHVCVYSPKQRGKVDVTGPSSTCYRPDPPCGGEPRGDPVAVYETGQTATIQFQQNLNHYSIGHPGFLEFSWNQNGDEKDFKVLDQIPDLFTHRELYQTNLTYRFQVPQSPTDHGVLRVRYVSQKPGEPIAFHQCVDVRVTNPSEKVSKSNSKESNPSVEIYALQYDPTKASTQLVVIDQFGKISELTSFPYPVRSSHTFQTNRRLPEKYIDTHLFNLKNSKLSFIEGVTTYNSDKGALVGLLGDSENPEDIPITIIEIPLKENSVPRTFKLRSESNDNIDAPISSIEYSSKLQKYVVMQLVKIDLKTFYFRVSLADPTTGVLKPIARGPDEKLFINYLWATLSPDHDQIYYLLRNEHDPFNLNQTIYQVDLVAQKLSHSVKSDVSTTYSCFHYGLNNKVYAPSVGAPSIFIPQGKHMTRNVILRVDLQDGSYHQVCATPIVNLPYQGGCVANSLNNDRYMYHFYKKNDNTFAFVSQDVENGKPIFTTEKSEYAFMHNFIRIQ